MSNSITRERLKQIVNEEREKLIAEGILSEAVPGQPSLDHGAVAGIVKAASDFMKALEKFKEKASPTMLHSMHPQLDKLETSLTDMITTPSSYVAVPKKVRQRVSLRNVNGDKTKAKKTK